MILNYEQFENDPAASQRQPRELRRVAGKIQDDVFEFCLRKVGKQFRMKELDDFVARRKGAAPGSAGRIMRLLKDEGFVKYRCINRRQSLYVIDEASGSFRND